MLVGYRYNSLVTLYVIGRKCERITVVKLYLFILKGADAVFRALGIKHYCNRKSKLFAHTLNKINLFLMLGMRTVREVESCNVHSGSAHSCENLVAIGCRTYGTDNFCFAHIYLRFS